MFSPATHGVDESMLVDGVTFAERVGARMPFFLLARFDRWSFPQPEELVGLSNYIPSSDDPNANRHFAMLFSAIGLPSFKETIARGLDSDLLIGLATVTDEWTLLDHLRQTMGVFMAANAMRKFLSQPISREMADYLGPVCGLMLGTNRNWSFYIHEQMAESPADFGFSDHLGA